MAIKKEKFFEIINEVSKSEGLNGDNLLKRIKDELYEIEKKLPEEDHGEYSKFKNDLWKDHLFSVKTSEEIAEDWNLLHLAVACNNLLTVELLLEKKVSVNARVKDGSKNDGLTALHIAASYGHENIIELLLSDNRVNPSLKSKNRTPREMVGNVPSRDTIIKMLEAAEESYRTKPKEKAKDLNIKIEGGGHYHLLQDSHGIPAKTVKKRNNVTAALESGNKRTSFNSTDGSSDSTVNEQYPRVNVKSTVEKIELPQTIDATYSDKRILTDESDSEDSGLELGLETASNTSSRSEINHDGANHVEENVDNQTLKNALRSQKEENQSLKQKMQELGNENATLNSELEKTQKELEESKSCIAGYETKLKEFNKENESPRQEIKNLKNENTTLKGTTKTKTDEVSLEKVEKRQFSPKVACASLAAMLAVGAALSIASGLSALLIVAASVVSALIAGGITYTISKPIAPDTELKEVDIQGSAQHGVCKT